MSRIEAGSSGASILVELKPKARPIERGLGS
jgi:hypothetical protein